MIGGLQTNKVKALPERLSMVQSLDRLNLAEALSKRQCALGKTLPVLIEINVSGEEQRSGVLEENFSELFEAVCRLPNLKIDGLMAIMPIADDPEALRPYFRSLRARFDRLRDAGYDSAYAFNGNVRRLSRRRRGRRDDGTLRACAFRRASGQAVKSFGRETAMARPFFNKVLNFLGLEEEKQAQQTGAANDYASAGRLMAAVLPIFLKAAARNRVRARRRAAFPRRAAEAIPVRAAAMARANMPIARQIRAAVILKAIIRPNRAAALMIGKSRATRRARRARVPALKRSLCVPPCPRRSPDRSFVSRAP